LIYITELNQMI